MNQVCAQQLLDRLGHDPAVFAHHIELTTERVLLAHIPLQQQGEASFLDERALLPTTACDWVAWDDFNSAAQKTAPAAPAYIFHVGHCGSTLVSRLLQETAKLRVLREPLPLRVMAYDAAHGLDRCNLLTHGERFERLRTFERSWACGAPIAIKATSICNDIIDDLAPVSPAAFIYVKPDIYLASLLKGQNSLTDLRAFAQMRLRRWNSRTNRPERLTELRAGPLAALCWLTEVSSVARAEKKILTVDFDRFLTAQAEHMSQLCNHFQMPVAQENVSSALRSPTVNQYSKNPARAYDAATRAAALSDARARMNEEIRDGLAWLETAARSAKSAQRAMERFS